MSCHKICNTVVFISCSLLSTAQRSELYLVDLLEIDAKYEVTNGRYLSDFNAGGYTNQPSFANLNTLLVTVGDKTEMQKTDIYSLDLRSKNITRITKTEDREYSPAISREDKGKINCVIVDIKNNNNQILWQYPLDRSEGGKPLLKDVNQVGYFCELESNWIAVFEVGTPNKLWLYNLGSGEKKLINTNIGRSLQMLKDGSLIYVHKFSDDYWFLKKVNTQTFVSEIVKKTLPDAEDFTLLTDDSILMGQGSKLYRLDQNNQNQWEEVANLERMAIQNIKRLAFNGVNQLAIVDQK